MQFDLPNRETVSKQTNLCYTRAPVHRATPRRGNGNWYELYLCRNVHVENARKRTKKKIGIRTQKRICKKRKSKDSEVRARIITRHRPPVRTIRKRGESERTTDDLRSNCIDSKAKAITHPDRLINVTAKTPKLIDSPWNEKKIEKRKKRIMSRWRSIVRRPSYLWALCYFLIMFSLSLIILFGRRGRRSAGSAGEV